MKITYRLKKIAALALVTCALLGAALGGGQLLQLPTVPVAHAAGCDSVPPPPDLTCPVMPTPTPTPTPPDH